MSESQIKNMDLEQIIRTVKQEAVHLETEQARYTRDVREIQVDLQPVDWPSLDTLKLTQLPVQSSYHAKDFLFLDDITFVRNAYQIALGRVADTGGLSNYLAKIRNGETRQAILLELVRSQEGRLNRANIKGLRGYSWLKKLESRLPSLGLVWKKSEKMLDLIQRQSGLLWFASQSVNFNLFLIKLQKAIQTAVKNHNLLIRKLEQEEQCRFQDIKVLEGRIETLRSQVRYLSEEKRSVSNVPGFSRVEHEVNHHASAYMSAESVDRFYFAFEEACRGTQAEIYERLRLYLPLIPSCGSKRVIDVGCGRGEWLDVLKSGHFEGKGLDINQVMVQICRGKGLDAEQADVIQYLKALPDNCLAAVTGFHVAEHISLDLLLSLFQEAQRVLEPGGKLILETPNPENLLVATHTFYHDPTHRNPLTPTLLSFMAQYYGFGESEILRLNPYPAEAKVPGIDPLTERVNGHLCGPQDFALIARK
ncbi:MAG: methyltransferase domain-containing protein [Limnobacter sp.]|nr:methyltransferase domain-containing protein [Limnobacter sp.]